MSEPQEHTAGYAQAVPAVQRALAVFERLAGEPVGLTLSELAKDLRISPSSLLAILNTLASGRYVARDQRTRRYRLASGLAALAGVVSGTPDLQQEFGPVAERLASASGETVALWVSDGDDVVLVASREGRHDLRWVPRLGLRQPATQHAAGQVLLARQSVTRSEMHGFALETGESTGEPRLLTIAALVLGDGGRRLAALTLTGPATRLHEPADAAREALRTAAAELSRRLGYRAHQTAEEATRPAPRAVTDGTPPWEAVLTRSGGLSPREFDDFLREPWIARLACVRESGYPYVVPVWYEWDGTSFWVVSRTRTDWAECVRRNAHVSMSIDEPSPPLRRVIVEGQAGFVEDLSIDQQQALASRIATRYLSGEGSLYWQGQPARPHALIRVLPVKMTTWRGLISHPRYRLGADEGIA